MSVPTLNDSTSGSASGAVVPGGRRRRLRDAPAAPADLLEQGAHPFGEDLDLDLLEHDRDDGRCPWPPGGRRSGCRASRPCRRRTGRGSRSRRSAGPCSAGLGRRGCRRPRRRLVRGCRERRQRPGGGCFGGRRGGGAPGRWSPAPPRALPPWAPAASGSALTASGATPAASGSAPTAALSGAMTSVFSEAARSHASALTDVPPNTVRARTRSSGAPGPARPRCGALFAPKTAGPSMLTCQPSGTTTFVPAKIVLTSRSPPAGSSVAPRRSSWVPANHARRDPRRNERAALRKSSEPKIATSSTSSSSGPPIDTSRRFATAAAMRRGDRAEEEAGDEESEQPAGEAEREARHGDHRPFAPNLRPRTAPCDRGPVGRRSGLPAGRTGRIGSLSRRAAGVLVWRRSSESIGGTVDGPVPPPRARRGHRARAVRGGVQQQRTHRRRAPPRARRRRPRPRRPRPRPEPTEAPTVAPTERAERGGQPGDRHRAASPARHPSCRPTSSTSPCRGSAGWARSP